MFYKEGNYFNMFVRLQGYIVNVYIHFICLFVFRFTKSINVQKYIKNIYIYYLFKETKTLNPAVYASFCLDDVDALTTRYPKLLYTRLVYCFLPVGL